MKVDIRRYESRRKRELTIIKTLIYNYSLRIEIASIISLRYI